MPPSPDAAISQSRVPAVDVPVLLVVVVVVVAAVMFWLPPVLSCCCAIAAGLIDATSATVHSNVGPTSNNKRGFLWFIIVASATSLLGVVCSIYGMRLINNYFFS
jgi:hypothetical protein